MAASFNLKSPSIKRIMQESRELARCPDPTITATPLESNLFEWHFTLTGPPASSYAQGIYHGRIILPSSYPLRPPSFRFLTPSGRFETNREICLSISGHHEETWQPAWGIRTALCAIRAFMAGDAKGQVGGLDMHPEAREKLARASRGWRCAACGGRSNEEIIQECEAHWRRQNPDGNASTEQTVPEELRLSFREDLEKAKEKETSPSDAIVTDYEAAVPHNPGDVDPATASTPSTEGPGQHPTSERRAPLLPAHANQHSAPNGPRQAHYNRPTETGESMPAWIDKVIIGLVLALLVMAIKKAAGPSEY